MSSSLKSIQERTRSHANPEIASHSQRFFKTAPGEYGSGDIFLGIRVPVMRKIAKEFKDVSLGTLLKLLKSKYHEERLLAVIMMVNLFAKSKKEADRKIIYDAYLANTQLINNWDLVDSSAHQIVGGYLKDKDRSILYELVQSEMLWERRIAMIATFHFIRLKEFEDTLQLATLLLTDKEDLMHKAVGWMLREVGNRHLKTETDFLDIHYEAMPRTMLRYAIEKFPEPLRLSFLKGTRKPKV